MENINFDMLETVFMVGARGRIGARSREVLRKLHAKTLPDYLGNVIVDRKVLLETVSTHPIAEYLLKPRSSKLEERPYAYYTSDENLRISIPLDYDGRYISLTGTIPWGYPVTICYNYGSNDLNSDWTEYQHEPQNIFSRSRIKGYKDVNSRTGQSSSARDSRKGRRELFR